MVQLPFAPTQAEEDDQDTDSDIGDMPELVSDDEGDVTEDDEADFNEADFDEEIEQIANDSSLDSPMSIDELETPLTAQTILDQHFQGGEYNAGGDQDITEEEALEIIEVLTTPPSTPDPTPIQVPNAPRRPRRTNRSHVQSPPPSPRAVADQHVTRRSSARLRQLYRRRRLQEEQDYSLTM